MYMQEPIETIVIPPHFEQGIWIDEKTLKIYTDDDPCNPRQEFDNFGHMVCFHRRYGLGDDHNINSGDFSSWDEIRGYLIKEKGACVILPVYLYDHSGITIRTTPFSCPWDSGQVGFIYATRQEIIDTWQGKLLTRDLREKAESILNSEVEIYDNYLTSDVYRYTVENTTGDLIDSCGGFYGYGSVEEVKKEIHMQYGSPARGPIQQTGGVGQTG